MKVKNQDKVKLGARVYNSAISEWGVVTEIDSCNVAILYDDYEDEDGNNELWEEDCYVYPLAEGVHYAEDDSCPVCYEVQEDIDFPYYVPDYDKSVGESDVVTE